tara:strand:- start:1796 stop:1930 length:135 start_codon:yes stop_codon:yes gene_type:complete
MNPVSHPFEDWGKWLIHFVDFGFLAHLRHFLSLETVDSTLMRIT